MGALVWIAALLFVLWILGFAVFKVASFVIHLLLILAVVMLIVGFFRRAT